MALFLKIVADISKQQKFITAGPTASWLWLAGVGHCRLSSTDGLIHRLIVPTLVPGLKNPFGHADTLVRAGLWTRVGEDFQVHDYFDWNPSRAELEQARREDADRKRVGRRRTDAPVSERNPSGVQLDALRGRADAGAPSPSVDGFPSADLVSEEIPISTVPPAWGQRSRRGGLVGSESGCRLNCAPWAVAACERGVCVPKFLWPQWEKRKPVAELRAFVEALAERAAEAGTDPKDFWPKAFAAHFGSSVPQAGPATTKGARTVQAFDDACAAIEARKGGVQ